MAADSLQTAFRSESLHLTHRVVLAPTTRLRASDDHVPSEAAVQYYCERATPGGLLISEANAVHKRGNGYPNTPGLWNAAQVEAWKPIVAAVKQKGGTFFAQLWHAGRVSVPSQTGGFPTLASTGVHLPGKHPLLIDPNSEEDYVDGQEMSAKDIEDVVSQFVAAAQNAIAAGFDGVEIHGASWKPFDLRLHGPKWLTSPESGANGYLLETFVHSNINLRTDDYGGSLANRLRFPLRLVDAVSAAIGRTRTAFRLSPFNTIQQTLDADRIATFSEYTERLEQRGLAYVHIVEPRYDQLRTEGSKGDEDEPSLWVFRKVLKKTPLVAAGGFDAASAREAIAQGRADLIAFGRHFTSNPDLVDRLFKDLPLTHYQRATFYTPGLEGYLGWRTASEDS